MPLLSLLLAYSSVRQSDTLRMVTSGGWARAGTKSTILGMCSAILVFAACIKLWNSPPKFATVFKCRGTVLFIVQNHVCRIWKRAKVETTQVHGSKTSANYRSPW